MGAVAQSPKSTDLVPGQIVGGRYRVDGFIGRGGMGEVYAATNESTGRRVALKMVSAEEVSDSKKRRFLREAKAATAIEHDHVIDILDVFEDDGTPVMVMELLDGESLASLLARRGRLSLAECATLLVPVGRALMSAHDKGIVHRDLKPDNIFLAKRGAKVVPKVLDFGIAKLLDPEAVISGTSGDQTKSESILGTPHYMSLEQAMGEKTIDHRTDIWAFGVILYEVLVGERPLQFDNIGQWYKLLLQEPVPSIHEAAPELDPRVADIIARCLVKDRDERLDDLGPVLDALEASEGQSVVIASGRGVDVNVETEPLVTPPSARVPLERPPLWVLALVVIVGAAVGIGLALRDDAPTPSETEPAAATTAAAAPTTAAPTPEPAPSATATASSAAVPVARPQTRGPQPSATAAAKPLPTAPPTPPTAPTASPRAKGLSTASPYP